jgi:DNA-binding transcriptional LysR family regulator
MPSLENSRLTVFRSVAENLSFRKAAEDLFLTQPAVSFQIKALEEELGVRLFDRTGRRPRLTAAGSLLFDYARRSSELLEQAGYNIAALGGDSTGRLVLGASTTIAQYILPEAIGAFAKIHPQVRPTLTSGNTEHIVEAVEKGTIALGFIEGPPRSNNVRTEPFLRDELVLVAPAAQPWNEPCSEPCSGSKSGSRNRRKSLSLAELATTPMLMRERGSGTRRIVELALERAGLHAAQLNVVMELDSTEAIKSAVAAGFGVGFVSRSAIAADLRLGKSIRILPIDDVRLQRDFLITMQRGPELRGLAREFRRFLLDHIACHATPDAPTDKLR